MGDFIRDNILPVFSLVFPLVMLSQFVINTLSKVIAKPKLSLHPAGVIEVGFSQLGPTLTLFGTLQTRRKDAFVTAITTVVRHVESGKTRSLEWRAFKPYTFGLQPTEGNLQVEPVSAFLLKVAAPFKYNTIFVDDEFVTAHIGLAEEVVDAWDTFEETMVSQKQGSEGIGNLATPGLAHYEAFYEQPEIQKIVQQWRDDLSWQVGTYEMDVQVAYPPETFQAPVYSFTLNEEDIEILQSNVKSIIFHLAGKAVRYKRVQKQY